MFAKSKCTTESIGMTTRSAPFSLRAPFLSDNPPDGRRQERWRNLVKSDHPDTREPTAGRLPASKRPVGRIRISRSAGSSSATFTSALTNRPLDCLRPRLQPAGHPRPRAPQSQDFSRALPNRRSMGSPYAAWRRDNGKLSSPRPFALRWLSGKCRNLPDSARYPLQYSALVYSAHCNHSDAAYRCCHNAVQTKTRG